MNPIVNESYYSILVLSNITISMNRLTKIATTKASISNLLVSMQ